MIYFRPCYPDHVRLIEPQAQQRFEARYDPNAIDELLHHSIAMSAWLNELCVGVAGIRPIWGGRAVAWALLSERACPAMTAIVRQLRFVLATYPANRIEMTVRAEFLAGCRLAGVLGFRCETPHGMPYFFPDGETGYLYARTRP